MSQSVHQKCIHLSLSLTAQTDGGRGLITDPPRLKLWSMKRNIATHKQDAQMYIEKLLTLWCKFLWMEFDILVHFSVKSGVSVIFIFSDVVADEPTNCCQQDLPMNT